MSQRRPDYDGMRATEARSQQTAEPDDDAPKTDLPNEYPQHMPRGSWLWPDDRTGMEWADKHDERL